MIYYQCAPASCAPAIESAGLIPGVDGLVWFALNAPFALGIVSSRHLGARAFCIWCVENPPNLRRGPLNTWATPESISAEELAYVGMWPAAGRVPTFGGAASLWMVRAMGGMDIAPWRMDSNTVIQ